MEITHIVDLCFAAALILSVLLMKNKTANNSNPSSNPLLLELPDKGKMANLLVVLFQLGWLFRRNGPQGLERHYENPEKSSYLCNLRALNGDSENLDRAILELCDTFRITLSADLNHYDLTEALLEKDYAVDPLSWEVKVVQAFLVGMQKGAPPLVAVEYARKILPFQSRPSFEVIDQLTRNAKLEERA